MYIGKLSFGAGKKLSFIRRLFFFFKYCVVDMKCPSSEVPLYILEKLLHRPL